MTKTAVKEKPSTLKREEPRTSKAPQAQPPAEEEVALKAYQLWQERGCIHGHDCDDWLQAERELKGKRSS